MCLSVLTWPMSAIQHHGGLEANALRRLAVLCHSENGRELPQPSHVAQLADGTQYVAKLTWRALVLLWSRFWCGRLLHCLGHHLQVG